MNNLKQHRQMKSNSNRILQILLSGIFIFMLAACDRETVDLGGNGNNETGTLSFTSFSISVSPDTEVISKADSEYPYWVAIFDSESVLVHEWAKNDVPASISLPVGSYSIRVQTVQKLPAAPDFESPIYGVTKPFAITAGQQTSLGSLTCKLLQVKVSVNYSESMKKLMGDDCKSIVSIDESGKNSLDFVKGEERCGYFLPTASSLIVKFSGTLAGSYKTATKAVTDIKAAQWRKITFDITINSQGKAIFNTIVDDQVVVSELLANVDVNEPIIGEDPDGGDPDQDGPQVTHKGGAVPTTPIIVTSGMPLSFQITATSGVKNFKVDMASTNSDFVDEILSTGVSPLDLINPTEGQEVICKIFGLPYRDNVSNQTDILFDLTEATVPLYGFAGIHTFTLTITDNDNKQTVCPIIMEVE